MTAYVLKDNVWEICAVRLLRPNLWRQAVLTSRSRWIKMQHTSQVEYQDTCWHRCYRCVAVLLRHLKLVSIMARTTDVQILFVFKVRQDSHSDSAHCKHVYRQMDRRLSFYGENHLLLVRESHWQCIPWGKDVQRPRCWKADRKAILTVHIVSMSTDGRTNNCLSL